MAVTTSTPLRPTITSPYTYTQPSTNPIERVTNANGCTNTAFEQVLVNKAIGHDLRTQPDTEQQLSDAYYQDLCDPRIRTCYRPGTGILEMDRGRVPTLAPNAYV